jgi:hypothetical protein
MVCPTRSFAGVAGVADAFAPGIAPGTALAGIPTIVRFAFEGADPATGAAGIGAAGAAGFDGAAGDKGVETPTIVRDAAFGARATTSRVPQKGHARAPSGVGSPHCGQCDMARM